MSLSHESHVRTDDDEIFLPHEKKKTNTYNISFKGHR